MKNFEKLFIELKNLHLPSFEFVVVGGACLAVNGLRDTEDIDLITTKELWNDLLFKYPSKKENTFEKIILTKNIEVLGLGSVYLPNGFNTTRELLSTSQSVNGINFANLEFVKTIKLQLARPKDLIDIELIDEHLGLHSVL